MSWTIQAKLPDGRVITDDPVDFVRITNLSPDRASIRELSCFFNGALRGTVEIASLEQRLILVRRLRGSSTVQQNPDGSFRKLGDGPQFIIFRVGWQLTIEGRNVKVILDLNPDGTWTLRNQ